MNHECPACFARHDIGASCSHRGQLRRARAKAIEVMQALSAIRDVHRPLEADDRLCAEGCSGAWPCTTRLEVDHALGNPRPQRT